MTMLPAAGNLILDGGFEPNGTIPDVDTNPNRRTWLDAFTPPGTRGAWSFTGGFQVDLMGSAYLDAGSNTWGNAYEGDQYLYISDSYTLYKGTARQTVGLQSGVEYRLSFAQTDFPAFDNASGWVEVRLESGSWSLTQSFLVPNTATGAWVVQELAFTIPGTVGDPASTSVTFSSQVGNPAIIDGIQLELSSAVVPEGAAGMAVAPLLAAAAWRMARRRQTAA